MTKPIRMLCNGSIRRLPPSPCHNRFQPVALPCLQYLYVTGCADRSAVVLVCGGRRRQKRGRGVGRRAAGMPHHPVRCRPGLPSQGSPPLPTTSVEHNITKVVEVHTLLYSSVHKVLLIFHCELKVVLKVVLRLTPFDKKSGKNCAF